LLGAERPQHQAGRDVLEEDRPQHRSVRVSDQDFAHDMETSRDSVGDTEHVPASMTQKQLNDDCLKMLGLPGPVWWGVFLLDLAILACGLIAERNQVVYGIGVAGHTRPVMWASYVTNFVFWVGIAHCGTLVSAVLFLFRSHFRRAVYRVAEAMTVFGVMTAGLFPIIHLGRPWF